MILGVSGKSTQRSALPVALSQSVVSELLDAFRAGEGVDLIRDAVQLVLQELIEIEPTVNRPASCVRSGWCWAVVSSRGRAS